MKPLTLIACAFCILLSNSNFANSSPSDTKPVNDARYYEIEASNKSAYEIYQTIRSLQEQIKLQYSAKDFYEALSSPEATKSGGYLMALKKLAEKNNTEAAFFYGAHQGNLCMGMKASNLSIPQKICDEAVQYFKIAANAKFPPAMSSLGQVYAEGILVEKSNMLSADWYLQSAEQYIALNQREEAIKNYEKALKEYPEHPKSEKIKRDLKL